MKLIKFTLLGVTLIFSPLAFSAPGLASTSFTLACQKVGGSLVDQNEVHLEEYPSNPEIYRCLATFNEESSYHVTAISFEDLSYACNKTEKNYRLSVVRAKTKSSSYQIIECKKIELID